MADDRIPPALKVGRHQARVLQEGLKPHLRAVGLERAAGRIGKKPRFFEAARYRGTMQLGNFLATCAALDLDPAEYVRATLEDRVAPEIRPPRIVRAAWERVGSGTWPRVRSSASAASSITSRARGWRRRSTT